MVIQKKITTSICCIYNLDGPISTTSDEIIDAMSDRKKNIHSKYGIHGVTEPFTINLKDLFRCEYQVHGRTVWFFGITAQRGGVSIRSSQVTPELFSCRLSRLVQTEKKSNTKNVTYPISNAQWFIESIIYNEDVVQKLENRRSCVIYNVGTALTATSLRYLENL